AVPPRRCRSVWGGLWGRPCETCSLSSWVDEGRGWGLCREKTATGQVQRPSHSAHPEPGGARRASPAMRDPCRFDYHEQRGSARTRGRVHWTRRRAEARRGRARGVPSSLLVARDLAGFVGATGFEPATSGTQSRPSTKLRYTPGPGLGEVGGRKDYQVLWLTASLGAAAWPDRVEGGFGSVGEPFEPHVEVNRLRSEERRGGKAR